MPDPFEPLTFAHGPTMKNRFALAPMTNLQSGADGVLSEDEFRWLTMRAAGGFGLTMTCAAHVQAVGQGFPGQLGVWDDKHLPGLARLAAEIKRHDSLAIVQLHHAGVRSPKELVGQPVGPSDDKATGSRALSLSGVEQLRDDFIAAAKRSEKAGFDGVEIHGAHGYIITAFQSEETNRRTDRYGGSPENRSRLFFEIVDGVRAATRGDFHLGVRLSPERFGLDLLEIRDVAQRLMREGKIDLLDMSLWDFRKAPNEEAHQGRSLMSYFTDLERGRVRLGAAGMIRTGEDVAEAFAGGLDAVFIGRAGIVHHDFPKRLRADARFASVPLPVSAAHLVSEGVGAAFLEYLRARPNFVHAAAE